MPWSIDARIPLVTVPDAASLQTALAEGRPAAILAEAASPTLPEGAVAIAGFEATPAAHAAACACCAGRGPAAAALDRLFQARVRGQCPWFERVLALPASEAGRAEIAAALATDAVTLARFRAG